MFLDTANKSIQVLTDALTTTESKFQSSYGVITNANETVSSTPGSLGTTTNTTPVTVVPAPSAGQTIVVKEMIFFNLDSVPRIFTVQLLDTATVYKMISVTVPVGGFLRYGDTGGWQNGPITGPGTVSSVAFTGDGTVFNATVPGSPVVTTGTFAPTLHTQTANMFLRGPTSGAAAASSFGPIVAADLPGGFNGFANPSASVGLAANNGSAVTAMRSDASCALDVTISPTWTGSHTFSNPVNHSVGSAALPSLTFTGHTGYGFSYDSTNVGIGGSINGAQNFLLSVNQLTTTTLGGGFAWTNFAEGIASFSTISYGASTAVYALAKAGGTIASPSVPTNGTTLGILRFRGFITGTTFVTGADIESVTKEPTWSTTARGTYTIFQNAKLGTSALVEVLRTDADSGVYVGGAVAIDMNRNWRGAAIAAAYQRVVPVTGFAQTISDNVSALVLKPAGTLATGTVVMPANPVDGQEVTLMSNQIITALTVNANTGQTISGTFTAATFAANAFAKWKYVLTDTNWYRAG